ncbi:MAG: AAA family ATPase [Kofleriaceae bacterium]|nr:AAA family ATPase [Kofleriaceae bacterium]
MRRRARDRGRTTAFIGRASVLAQVLALAASRRTAIVWIHGPGGVGKSSLLRELERRVHRRRRVGFVRVDAIDPRPEPIVANLARTVGAARTGRLRDLLARRDPPILMLDGFEAAPALGGWLADELADAPARGGTIVVATRQPPGNEWRLPVLARRSHSIALSNLEDDEAMEFLSARGVDRSVHARLLAFTRGHPLALAVAAEHPAKLVPPDGTPPAPEVLRVLLDGMVERSLSVAERRALEVAPVVPALTETLLARLTADDDSHARFRWLQDRPYVRSAAGGLVVHDLVREVIESDFRWRDPERHAAVALAAVERYCEELGRHGLGTTAAFGTAHALAWMFCRQPSLRSTFEAAAHELYFDAPRRGDLAILGQLIETVDGREARRSWERSRRWQREATVVARDGARRVRGLWVELVLDPARPVPDPLDPAIVAAHLAMQGLGLARGQRGSLQRFQLDGETHRGIGPTIQLRVAHDARVLLNTPGIAVRWICAPAGFRWAKVWESRGYVRLEPFTIEGASFALWQLDLRGTLAARYVIAAYQGAGAVDDKRGAARNRAPITLRELREALLSIGDPTTFARSSLAARYADLELARRAARFREQVEQELAGMSALPRGNRLRSTIVATYLTSHQSSQEQVAESLGMPFRTYRDNLTRGLTELARRLAEQGGDPRGSLSS